MGHDSNLGIRPTELLVLAWHNSAHTAGHRGRYPRFGDGTAGEQGNATFLRSCGSGLSGRWNWRCV